MEKTVTRRDVIRMLGLAAGAGVLGTASLKSALASAVAPPKADPHGLPWKYVPLDPQKVAERGYKSYYEGHCMYGAFEPIIGELADKLGEPYKSFPMKMMTYGAGGVAEWATLCGSLNGGAAALALLVKDPKPLIDELYSWYQSAKLPDFRPSQPKFEIAQSVAKSTLCHVSVSRWCKATGFKSFSKERAERCAWITASVARKTAELLNAHFAGTFKAVYPIPARVEKCRSCHDKASPIENTRGKIDCDSCHFTGKEKHKEI